jgi:hypothetical protein
VESTSNVELTTVLYGSLPRELAQRLTAARGHRTLHSSEVGVRMVPLTRCSPLYGALTRDKLACEREISALSVRPSSAEPLGLGSDRDFVDCEYWKYTSGDYPIMGSARAQSSSRRLCTEGTLARLTSWRKLAALITRILDL